jgi:threonine/homoserine/homoserine lactone efflux protein
VSDELISFVAGLGAGLAVAAPLGPMGILCIERTLAMGAVAGLATGLGAATVHVVYSAVALLGLGAGVEVLMKTEKASLSLVSAAILFWFALRTVRRRPTFGGARRAPKHLVGSYFGAVAFGLTNPVTLVLFAGILPALADRGGSAASPLTVAGIGAGSVAWWIGLIGLVASLRSRLSLRLLGLCNWASGLALAALGLAMICRAVGVPP